MILERDGFMFVPIKTFAMLSGVSYDKVRTSINSGIIHHSYVLKINAEDLPFKYRTFIREDKAEAYREFMSKYKTWFEVADICRKWFHIKIDSRQFGDMILQGYVPVEWCIFIYPNMCLKIVYILVDKIYEIADAYKTYVSEKEKRKRKGNVAGEETVEYQ